MKRLTRKQAKLARERVKDPEASFSELAGRSGYADRAKAHEALNKPHVQAKIAELMNARPKLRDESLLKKLEDGLDAEKVTYFQHEGKVTDERSNPDLVTRHRYLETALVLKGHKRPEGEGAGGAAVMVNIITALADAQKVGLLPNGAGAA